MSVLTDFFAGKLDFLWRSDNKLGVDCVKMVVLDFKKYLKFIVLKFRQRKPYTNFRRK